MTYSTYQYSRQAMHDHALGFSAPATDYQRKNMKMLGLSAALRPTLTVGEAARLINQAYAQRRTQDRKTEVVGDRVRMEKLARAMNRATA